VLSSSCSFKKKIGTHLSGWEKNWEVGQDFETLWQVFLVTLEHGTYLHSTYSWEIHLSLIHTISMYCHNLLIPSKRTFGCRHIMFGFMPHRVNASKSLVVLCNVQGKSSQLQSTFAVLSIFIPVSFCPHFLYHLKSIS
jgi:hypothetical protein